MHKASTRKRVLMLTGSFGIGGLEMYVLNLVRTAGGRIGFDICSKGSADGDCKPLYLQAGAGVLHLPQSRTGFKYFLRLWQLLRRERYDAVCDFTGDLGGLTALAARFAGVRRRLVCYRSALRAFRPTLIRRLYISFHHGLVNRLATAIVSNSFAALDNYFGDCWRKHPDKYFVIRNGIRTDIFRIASADDKLAVRRELGLPPDALVVGTVAGLRREKNLSVIIEILDRLRERQPALCALLVGEGQLRPELEELVASCHLQDRIVMPGMRRDVQSVLAAMDLFILPSYFEGMPNALIEAQCVGLACVVNDRPEIREVVPSANRELSCVDMADLDKAADRVELFLKSPKLRVDQGTAARQYVLSHFPLDDRAAEFYQLLTDNGGDEQPKEDEP